MTSAEKRTLRFAVGTAQEYRSAIWRLWVERNDAYLAARTLGGLIKLSLHESASDTLDVPVGLPSCRRRAPAICEKAARRRWLSAKSPRMSGLATTQKSEAGESGPEKYERGGFWNGGH